jgi:hypothetical protein
MQTPGKSNPGILSDWALILRARRYIEALGSALTAYQLMAELPKEALDAEARAHGQTCKVELERLLACLTPADPAPLTGRS